MPDNFEEEVADLQADLTALKEAVEWYFECEELEMEISIMNVKPSAYAEIYISRIFYESELRKMVEG